MGDSEALAQLPWRGPGPDRPQLPLPPDQLPLFGAGRRIRKRWRYIGAFCDEFLLCAARVQLGPIGQTFWAIVDRSSGEMLERTRKRPPFARGEVWSELPGAGPWPIGSSEPGVLTRIEAKGVRVFLRVGEGKWAESVCPNGEGGYVWTRKRIAPIECDLRFADGRRVVTVAHGIEDESAGYHPRRTIWSWSAGVGSAADGRPVGWNLVSGVNDPPQGSERAIWIDGEPSEPGPVSFDEDLSGITFEGGERLDFTPEAERRASENLGLVAFEYRQPFGSFSGSLGGVELAEAAGVMEYHDALW